MAIVISKDNDGNVTITENGVERELFPNEQLVCDVTDVQINGTSIIDDGVANIPHASSSVFGVTRYGSSAEVKAGTITTRSIIPAKQHESVFYGLAKASGDSTQSESDNPVGTYTAGAKQSIKSMLGVREDVVIDGADIAGIYAQISALEQLHSYPVFGSGAAMGIMTGDYITNAFKGIVCRVGDDTYDFFGLYGTSGIRSFRLTGMTAEAVGALSNKKSYTSSADT